MCLKKKKKKNWLYMCDSMEFSHSKVFLYFALVGTFAFEAQECCLGGSQGFILIIVHKYHSSVVHTGTVFKQVFL